MSQPVIRVGGYAPPASAHSRALDRFAEFVRDEADEAVVVDVLHNVMDLGRPAADLLDMMTAGDLTLCYFSTSYLGSTVPLVDALEIPFLFDTLAGAHDALDGPFGDVLSDAIRSGRGCEVLGFWDNGFRHLTNRVRPIRSPADCEGLTIRLQPNRVHEALAVAWGMSPVLVELSEGIELIASGAVDAQENPLANTSAYGVTHQHISLTAHLYGARGLFANPDQLEALGADLAEVVRRGARAAIEFQRAESRRHEDLLRDRFEAEGRSIVELSVEERHAFAEAAGPVIAAARAEIPADVLALLDR